MLLPEAPYSGTEDHIHDLPEQLPRLAQAARKAKARFDLAILDEAHKTVGLHSKAFATLLSDKKISIRRRLFMTATERVLKGHNDAVLSKEDAAWYGERFHLLTFKEAINPGPSRARLPRKTAAPAGRGSPIRS